MVGTLALAYPGQCEPPEYPALGGIQAVRKGDAAPVAARVISKVLKGIGDEMLKYHMDEGVHIIFCVMIGKGRDHHLRRLGLGS